MPLLLLLACFCRSQLVSSSDRCLAHQMPRNTRPEPYSVPIRGFDSTSVSCQCERSLSNEPTTLKIIQQPRQVRIHQRAPHARQCNNSNAIQRHHGG
ncbi:hypothetical protein CCHR01_08607 [Colletotrichum chrysophilum]|uniref:Secreted protein n=1 Tax=Colletotrichum chrysophilum TaxID=1836956 RepID=A0AAD9AI48_9PEZI|nr:hypothetical protein CCHR01_08607 [Colletotrichum chrysophilum]